jgi:DNA mismatch repair protein MutL
MLIQVLTPDLISKIAAGEVVERPASVVKELIENAIDAEATRITVEARRGGIDFIKVIDNGAGMPADQVALAFERHATSKISSASDLESISTLGFRGEALPSIAAVSQIDIVTRVDGEVSGTHLSLTGGEVVEQGKRAGPQGTSVTVKKLFQNVPARLKFLKSVSTESAHISELVGSYSLAYPEVQFELSIDGKPVLQTAGSGVLRDAIVEVYGLNTAEAMIEVGEDSAQVYGFVSQPSMTRARRDGLSFFVNRRWVKSNLLMRATEEAYSGLIMVGKHPIAVLNIILPSADLDVNVHPAKTEVRFRSEGDVFVLVQRAVRAALTQEMVVPQARRAPQPVGYVPQRPARQPAERQSELFAEALPSMKTETAKGKSEARLPILRVIGQLGTTYIIAEGPDGMYLIDQHAAHERIVYERVLAQRAAGAVAVQGMLAPLTVELTPRQESVLKDSADALAAYGFAIEPFGQRAWMVRSVPAVLDASDIAATVAGLLDELSQAGGRSEIDERIAASIACHGAVRAGKVLTADEMSQLVRDLEKAESPLNCPHGRPTMVHFTTSHLEREFGRRV